MDVTDPRRLRALAHPLRLDLIETLTMLGSATAAECAREVGSTQANCSFHLRQLARFGFVEEAEPRADGRARPWRLTSLEQTWSSDDAAADQLERVFVQREAERILGWLARSADEPEAWTTASFRGGMTLPMTAAELDEVSERLRAVLQPYVERLSDRDHWPEDSRFVRVLLSAVPLTTSADLPERATPTTPEHAPERRSRPS
jgi:predicted ArsR family transcriptional regulator